MSNSISISNPNKLLSLEVTPYGAGDKLGGVLDLSIFTIATDIEISGLDITGLGDVFPSNLINFNASSNKLKDIPTTFEVPDSILNFDLSRNNLTKADIGEILGAFKDRANNNVQAISPQPIIDVSKFGNEIITSSDTDQLTLISDLQTLGWNVKYNEAEYVLSTTTFRIYEGGADFTIDIERTATNVDDNTLVDYEYGLINNVDNTRISSSVVSGQFTIIDNKASATFNVPIDAGIDEYQEDHTWFIATTLGVGDTELRLDVVDRTVVPYTLTATNFQYENRNFDIVLAMNSVDLPLGYQIPIGTTVPYTISGIQAEDIQESLRGNFVFVDDGLGNSPATSGNECSITINVIADGILEGPENLIITLDDYPAPEGTSVSNWPAAESIRIYDQRI
jgi:hypothetical protein